jgi:hypothetical protein
MSAEPAHHEAAGHDDHVAEAHVEHVETAAEAKPSPVEAMLALVEALSEEDLTSLIALLEARLDALEDAATEAAHANDEDHGHDHDHENHHKAA